MRERESVREKEREREREEKKPLADATTRRTRRFEEESPCLRVVS